MHGRALLVLALWAWPLVAGAQDAGAAPETEAAPETAAETAPESESEAAPESESETAPEPEPETETASESDGTDEFGSPTVSTTVTADPAEGRAATPDDGMSDEDRRILEETRLRRDLGGVHRALGISTWLAMTGAAIFGFIQYYDLYGIQASREDAPCTAGTAVFQEFCTGESWPHRAFVIGTSVLYTATFSLSLAMPDPNHVSEGNGAFAERIRAHQILRWIHLAGMVLQTVIGLGVANDWFGDRANNYNELQVLAGVHQAIGWTTWFTVGLAGAIMLF